MPLFLSELQGWLAFLQRSSVLLQLVLVGGLLMGLLRLRHSRPKPRWRLLWTLPLMVPLLMGEALIGLGLVGLGQRAGLVLLLGQFSLCWLLLRLLETQLLARWLPPQWQELGISRLLRPLYLIAVLTIVLDALGSLQDLAEVPLGVWFGGAISLGNLATVLVVLYVLLVGLPLPAAVLSLLVQRSLNMSEGSRRALDQILRYLIFSLGVVWAMGRLGFNQTGVLAIAGGLSVGLGFGIKEVFSNIISGLWLLIEGSVRPGEVLMHQGEVCEVRRLGPRATVLWRSSDNAELVVPNQTFFVTSTTTYTGSDRMRRCSLPIGVSSNQSPDEILTLLPNIASSHADVLAVPAPGARLVELGKDRYGYSLEFSINDPLHADVVSADLRLAICRRFQELGMDPPN